MKKSPGHSSAAAGHSQAEGVVANIPSFAVMPSTAHRGEVAVVTGGNRGLGLEICRLLGAQAFTVILTARDAVAGERAASVLRREGLDVRFVALDVTRAPLRTSLLRYLQAELGRLDVLVNNAGIALDPPDAEGRAPVLSAAERRLTFAINSIGPRQLTEKLLPLLRRSPVGGRVINVSTDLTLPGSSVSGYTHYRAAKLALNRWTKELAAREPGVAVNCISPGWIRTRMGGPDAPDTPADGAQTAVWLATVQAPPSGGFFRRLVLDRNESSRRARVPDQGSGSSRRHSRGRPPPPGSIQIERLPL